MWLPSPLLIIVHNSLFIGPSLYVLWCVLLRWPDKYMQNSDSQQKNLHLFSAVTVVWLECKRNVHSWLATRTNNAVIHINELHIFIVVAVCFRLVHDSWLSFLLDLNVCNFYLWGHVKHKACWNGSSLYRSESGIIF